jgi:spore germination protein PC
MNQWSDYLSQIHRYIQQQDDRIKSLEERVTGIEEETKKTNPTTIEKIEYNFDQLKIERLDGSLHIGISPEDLSKVGDMSLGNAASPPSPFSISPKQSIYSELDAFMSDEAPTIIQQEMREQHKPIDPQFIQTIIQDIKKQIPSRIAYYEQQATNDERSETEANHYIVDQVKNEISHSLRQFFQQSNNKGE